MKAYPFRARYLPEQFVISHKKGEFFMKPAKQLLLFVLFFLFLFHQGISTKVYAALSYTSQVRIEGKKDAYYKASDAIKNSDFSTRFVFPFEDLERNISIFTIALSQSPYHMGQRFYYGYWYDPDTGMHLPDAYIQFSPGNTQTKSTIKKKIRAIDKKAASIAKKIKKQYRSPYSRMKAAHDYLCRNVRYEHGGDPDSFSEKNTAYAALFKKRAVCQGYSAAYNLILRNMGIRAITVCGGNHSWNLVYYNRKARHVDVTWDDPDRDSLLFDTYFLKTDAEFRKTHTWNKKEYNLSYLKMLK